MNDTHKCVAFRQSQSETPWRSAGLFRERDVESVSYCRDCGRRREGRFRKVIGLEREAGSPSALMPDPSLRRIASRLATLSRKHSEVRAAGVVRRLGGIQAESEIERLATAAPLRLIYHRSSGIWRLKAIRVLERTPLEEIANPGVAARRATALEEAGNSLSDLVNPEAVFIRELLGTDRALAFDETVIKALVGLARLVEAGDVLSARIFSSQVLGGSKSLARVRQRLEHLVGPIERLGIRDWGGVVLMGGAGALNLDEHTHIQLDCFKCIGLASEDIFRLRDLDLPAGGVLVIENLTPFHTCLERLREAGSVLILWSGGFPNRGVKRLLEQAARQKARVRIWCDIDLGGIRIARLIHDLTSGTAEPILMGTETVTNATIACPLSAENRSSIRRDLERHPNALLADTLRALLERGTWIEQETLLSYVTSLSNSE